MFFFAFFFAGSVKAEKLPHIALYGDAKYAHTFESFDYVYANAPKGGKIVMPSYGSFDNFNPFIFKGIAAPQVVDLTLDTLAIVPSDDFSTAYPLIAKSFELTDEYISFFIDERAKFADGTPVLADDVAFSFESLLDKGSPFYKVYYSGVERVEKIAPRHVRFWFNHGEKNKELPLIISQLKIFSKKDWEGREFATPSLKAPLGSGPYLLEGFSPNKFISLKRNPNYWAKDLPSRKGFYNFDIVRYDYYQDTTVTLQALFSGNIDAREEYIAKIWVTGYDNELIRSGKIIKEDIASPETARLQNFSFNIRKPMFANKKAREAIGWAFNFEWANENLFYNQYSRLYSYFTNSGMEATALPEGEELAILEKYRHLLPEEVFATVPQNPVFGNSRENLRHAVALLREAGYDFVDGKMTNMQNLEPLEFEILSNSANGSSFTRVMLPFLKNLEKIGIKATFRNLETNVFKNRLDNFDFDMVIVTYPMSQMPGNEQKEFWGSSAADIKGSYNLIGIKNPVVDEIVNALVLVQEKDEYVAHIKALDRVLLNENYMIMQWYSPNQRVAYHDKFHHPKTETKVGFQPFTWWAKESKK